MIGSILSVLFLHVWLGLPLASQATAQQPPSLQSKIAQMLMMGFDVGDMKTLTTVQSLVAANQIGGVMIFLDPELRQAKPLRASEIRSRTHQLQTEALHLAEQQQRPFLPLLVAIDEEGGRIDRLRTLDEFEPTLPAALYPSISTDKLQHELNKMSLRVEETGFNLDLAPVIDVNVNASNPIIGRLERSYSAEPMEVVHYAQMFSEALLSRGIQCTYKHFPGHGSATADSHEGFVDVSKIWKSYELLPYQLLIASPHACRLVMTAHIVNKQLDPSGLPATLSYTMLTKVLRQHLQFKGVIISDDMQMKAISSHYTMEDAVVKAINAGVDILLFADIKKLPFASVEDVIHLIEAKVQAGVISSQRIDDAYAHIVALKQSLVKERMACAGSPNTDNACVARS